MQIDAARRGEITLYMLKIARKEHRDPQFVREGVAAGRIAMPANSFCMVAGTGNAR